MERHEPLRSRNARRRARRAIKREYLEVLRKSPGGEKLLADPEKLRRRLDVMMKHLAPDVQHRLSRMTPEENRKLEAEVPGVVPGPLKHVLRPNGLPKRTRRGVKL